MLNSYREDLMMENRVISPKKMIQNKTKLPVTDSLSSPPIKRLKQARLPFKQLDEKSPITSINKKRKNSTNDLIIKGSKFLKSDDKKNLCFVKLKRINEPKENLGYKKALDVEVSSSCETANPNKPSPEKSSEKDRCKGLEWFLRTTQQPQVSTSQELIDLVSDDSNNEAEPAPTCEKLPTASVQSQSYNKTNYGSKEITQSKCESSDEFLITKELIESQAISINEIAIAAETKSDPHSPKSENEAKSKASLTNENTDMKELLTDIKKDSNCDVTCKKLVIKSPKSNNLADSLSSSVVCSPENLVCLESVKKKKVNSEKLKLRLEAKHLKEQERLEVKLMRDKEKQEKKDRDEIEKQKKLEKKEEERKKKQDVLEAKVQEKRKKEEEKRKKEEEKKQAEEEELRKKVKIKVAFESFFVKKDTTKTSKPKTEGLFMPFEVKKNMRLAVKFRVSKPNPEPLDKLLHNQNAACLYLEELRSKTYTPLKTGRTFPKDDDVTIINDSTIDKNKMLMKAKLLQFHTDYRPAYYGTYRKRSGTITGRRPFHKDLVFDYEVDSDDEWEEEEPGESLSHSEGEDKDEDDDDGSEDDGFIVPHGHLSEGEGGLSDDEQRSPDHLKKKEEANVKAWEAQMTRACQPLKPFIIESTWMENLDRWKDFMHQFKMVTLRSCPIATHYSVELALANGDSEFSSPDLEAGPKNQKRLVPKEAVSDLIRLLHGNRCGRKKLVDEFIEYWRLKSSGHLDSNNVCKQETEQTNCEKLDKNLTPTKTKDTNEYMISKRQLELMINKIAVYKKCPETNNKICWLVHEEHRKKYNLLDLPLPNVWIYVSSMKEKDKSFSETPTSSKSIPSTPSIMNFIQRPASRPQKFYRTKSAIVTSTGDEAINSTISGKNSCHNTMKLSCDDGYNADSEEDCKKILSGKT